MATAIRHEFNGFAKCVAIKSRLPFATIYSEVARRFSQETGRVWDKRKATEGDFRVAIKILERMAKA